MTCGKKRGKKRCERGRGTERGQGAFEYILLLAGILLVVVTVITVVRYAVLPAANQTLAAGLEHFLGAVTLAGAGFEYCSFNLCDGIAINLEQPAVGEVVVRVSSPDCIPGLSTCVFNSSEDSAENMSFSQANYRVFVNVSRKYGQQIDGSIAHAVNVTANGSLVFSSSVAPPSDATPPAYKNTTSLIAGNGTAGYAEGVGANAAFYHPADVAVSGNYLYVVDQWNHRIRRIE